MRAHAATHHGLGGQGCQQPYHAKVSEYPTATLVASCFRRPLPVKNANRLRVSAKQWTTCEAWSAFEASVSGLPAYVEGSFAAGIGFGPGGVEPTAEFKITGDVLSVRNIAVSLAKQFGQTAVRVNFESAAEPLLFELDLWLSDWRLEYLLPAGSPATRAEVVWWLTKECPVEAPSGRVVRNRLVIDGGLGFVAKAHRTIAERFGRPISVSSVLVERWGKDGEQRGFLREQRIERAGDEELGRILLA